MLVFRFILLAMVLSVFRLNDFYLPLWYLRIPFNKLNNGKSPDEFGLSAEHLKYGREILTLVLTCMFNNIMRNRIEPTEFKFWIFIPVIKWQKSPIVIGNFRGITVTTVIGKLHEYCLLRKLNLQEKSDLQFGFTEKICPLMASVVITKTKFELNLNKAKKHPSILTTVDVKSAFGVVQHVILFDKLLEKNSLSSMASSQRTSRMKRNSDLSRKLNIKRRVRQGGILSTHIYKRFVLDLLKELERNSVGRHLGTIYVGTPDK